MLIKFISQKLKWWFWLGFLGIVLSYFWLWLWIWVRWLSGPDAYVHILLFLGLGWLVVRLKLWRQFELRKVPASGWLGVSVLLFGLERVQAWTLELSIVSAMLAVLILVSWGYGFYENRLSIGQQLAWLLLILACLPVFPLLGTSIGLVTRQIYVLSIWSILSLTGLSVERIGTSLFSGNYVTHIDAGCSGVQGLYLLSVLVLVGFLIVGENKRFDVFKIWYVSVIIYLILNGVRVGMLVWLNNGLHLANIMVYDKILSIGIVGGVLIWVYRKIIN